ncbi:MAG TPA: NAD(+) synthase [Thermoanaerobaculia bacterium]|nr:NAD(+) synthase [Thermoanaerobaculia bacterium]
MADLPFENPYRHGFVRVAVAIPSPRVADPDHSARRVLELVSAAHQRRAALVVFPELVLTGYTCDDLFHQEALLEATEESLAVLVAASAKLRPVLVVDAPLRREGKLFNCAVVIHDGAVLGVVPKTYLPNYREYYEKRQFVGDEARQSDWIDVAGCHAPFGARLLFEVENVPGFTFHVEICEDLWAPVSPSSFASLAGATVLVNPSASNVTIDKAAYRRLLCQSQSGKCVAAYVYAGAGYGESTTDLAWDGHGLICENAEILAETQRFADDGKGEGQLLVADVDLGRLVQERVRLTTLHDAARRHRGEVEAFGRVGFEIDVPGGKLSLEREIQRFPFVPASTRERDERCAEAYAIQVHGLVQRLQATGIERVVIGVSGGLDSTQALIVAVQALEKLGLPRANVLAYTMPGFGTSEHTLESARALMAALSVSASEIDIRPSCRQMLEDIGHPFAAGEPVHDVTFENVQAGDRTSHLFRLANLHRGLVVGTGDLSELALGWCTYGVGDQMSHYNVNASVPKTLVQHLIRWVADRELFGAGASEVLRRILETEISPELVPASAKKRARKGKKSTAAAPPVQSTEQAIGPFDLQDFHLYYISRFGFRPSKVAYLAHRAWAELDRGRWPPGLRADERREYSLAEIKRWLEVFLRRFFAESQFKRSAMPNAPKVGSGGSLSPRGDWRAPSDASAEPWLEELRRNVP